MKDTSVLGGKILVLSLTVIVAMLTAACFTIILEEQEPEVDSKTVAPVRGELNLRPEVQPSDQDVNALVSSEVVSATDIFVATVIPGPTNTGEPEPVPAYGLSVNGVPATDSTLALHNGTVEISSPTDDPAGLYRVGDRIRLTAIPEGGYRFDGWGGDCSSDGLNKNVCVLTIGGNEELSAGFVPQERFFALHLATDPDGAGKVQVQPSPNAPGGRYVDGTHLELKAIDAEAFEFSGWGGECAGDGECRIVMNGDKSVTASFLADLHTLTINHVLLEGSGMSIEHGVISVSPVVSPGNRGYAAGTLVSLTAIPHLGYILSDWGGDCSGAEPNSTVCTINIDGDQMVEVAFLEEAAGISP